MPNLVEIYDGGTTVMEINGHPVNYGVLIFRTSENESAPVDYKAFYRLHYRDSIIKNLGRIFFPKQEQKPKEYSAARELPCARSLQEDQKEAQPDA